jgi:hypothetical protein
MQHALVANALQIAPSDPCRELEPGIKLVALAQRIRNTLILSDPNSRLQKAALDWTWLAKTARRTGAIEALVKPNASRGDPVARIRTRSSGSGPGQSSKVSGISRWAKCPYRRRMREFLIESYVSGKTASAAVLRIDDVARTAGQLSQQGTEVRFLRAIFIPEEETCFYLYESSSGEAVREAATRAGLAFERMTEAVSITAPARVATRSPNR